MMISKTLLLTMKIMMILSALVCLAPISMAQNDGRSTYIVIPMFANGVFPDGSYYRSTFMESNPSLTESASCTATAWVNGSSGTDSAITAPDEWAIDSTSGTGQFYFGYTTMRCDKPMNANLVYSYYSRTGQKLGEATVFSSPVAKTLQLLVDQREGARLGIAIVNDTASAQNARIDILDEAGNLAATTTVPIAAHRNVAKFLDEFTSWQGLFGQMLITCNSGCGATGLRFTGTVFTTIPVTVRVP